MKLHAANVCFTCWYKFFPDRKPTKIMGEVILVDVCCFCGRKNTDNIYTREDAEQLKCKHAN